MKNTGNYMSCTMCKTPVCLSGCKKLDLSKILFNLKMDNERYIASTLPKINPCIKCNKKCRNFCVLKEKINFPLIINNLYEIRKTCKKTPMNFKSLEIKFFGKKMENPFLLSSSIVGSTYEKCARAFKAGWAGVALKTITYIPIRETSPRYESLSKNNIGFSVFKNIEQLSQQSVNENIKMIRKLKQDYPTKIIIASLMGRNEKEWVKLSKLLEKAGADALELNFSCPNMEMKNTGSDVGQVPSLVYKYTKAVKQAVKIPVLAKLTPNVDNMSPAAEAAVKANVDGIAAINTIKSLIIPTLENNDVKLSVGGLSGKCVKPIALRFINEIKQNRLTKKVHVSGMGGIETYIDALDFLRLGCNSLQVTTAIMEYGLRIIEPLKTGLLYYLETNKYKNVKEIIGNKLIDVLPLDKRERNIVNYPIFDRKKCIGCGRCVISCTDGAHEALTFSKERKPILNAKKCEGCHLCINVCPCHAIKPSKVTIKK